MKLSPLQWHKRFIQQAKWTEEVRNFQLERAAIDHDGKIIEVGCGTGVVLSAISNLLNQTHTSIHGVDINPEFLNLAAEITPTSHLLSADAHSLPFSDHSFDMSVCHFLLLWVENPTNVVSEMARITRSDGFVFVLAEPDYGGRIDFPPELELLGDLQETSLSKQGANPRMGRHMGKIFTQAGLNNIEIGVINGHWSKPPARNDWESEWEMLGFDISGDISKDKFNQLKIIDKNAWQTKERVLFVPTFYASGQVP